MKLEIGKYYVADNGDIIGPMDMWNVDYKGLNHPFEIKDGTNKYCEFGDIWRSDGISTYKGIPALVSEYIDSNIPVTKERVTFPTYQDAAGNWFYIKDHDVVYPYGVK